MSTASIGICQIKQGYDFRDNLSRALAMLREAAARGAGIVALPEMFFTPYEIASVRRSASLSEEALPMLQEEAAAHGVMIVAGSMPWQADGSRLFNRSMVIGRDGQVIHHHDKIHLFDCSPPGGPTVKESDFIMPGGALATFDTPWGKAAVVVCYDIRFAPLAQILSDWDVRLLFVPAAFSLSTGTAHWEMLVRIRAVEIQGFVIGVQPARNDSLKYVPYGHSLVVSPWGEVLLDAGQEEGVFVTEVDLGEVEAIRERFPLVRHRRRDLYQTVWRSGK